MSQVEEINRRIKSHKSSPAYITPIQDLSSRLLAWDSKSTVILSNKHLRSSFSTLSTDDNDTISTLDRPNSSAKAFPKVNIIGCLQPIDLILAKADERIRKHNQYAEQRKAACEEKSKDLIQRMKVDSSYSSNLVAEQLQFVWIKILLALKYGQHLHISFCDLREQVYQIRDLHRSSLKIQNLMKRWFYRHQFRKYRLSFFRMLGRNSLQFKLNLRILVKRKSAQKVITFLREQQSNSKVNK